MASRGSSRHSRALKKLRPYLIKELPEPVELLDNSELRTKFSGYERSHIIAPSCQSQRAEKFLEVMEFAPQEVFEIFMTVLRTMKPDLGMRLKDTLKNMEIFSGAPSSPQQGVMDVQRNGSWVEEEKLVDPVDEMGSGVGRQPQAPMPWNEEEEEEDAGPFGLNKCSPGHDYQHMSCLSYKCREYLSTRLNGSCPERNTFHSFCHALRVDEKLLQVAARSCNPTAYLIQKLSEQRDGTMERLERALVLLGMSDAYEHVMQML